MTDVVKNLNTGAIITLNARLEERAQSPAGKHLQIIRDYLPPGAKRKPGRPAKADEKPAKQEAAQKKTSKKKVAKKKTTKKTAEKATKKQATYDEIAEKIKAFEDAEDELDAYAFEQLGIHLDQRVGIEKMKEDALSVIDQAKGSSEG